MEKIFFVIVLNCIFFHFSFGQDSTQVEHLTLEENAALVSMTAILVPLAIAGTVIGYVPPSAGIIISSSSIPINPCSPQCGLSARTARLGFFKRKSRFNDS